MARSAAADSGVTDAYVAILKEVGDGAPNFPAHCLIASHWPFVGSHYGRLLLVGQALAGWDDKATAPLWSPDACATQEGRGAVLEHTRAYATSEDEHIKIPLRSRSHSPFWSLSKRVVELLEPSTTASWFSRYAWWNLFPLGWGRTNRSPWYDALWNAQAPHLRRLFDAVVTALDPDRIVILAGKDFWTATAPALGLDDLPLLPRPLIAGGVRDGRTIVWTYHPGARLSGISRAAFAAEVSRAVAQLGPGGS